MLNENSVRLSRTRKGISDTGTSRLKRPLLLAGDALRSKTQENEQRVYAFVAEAGDLPRPNSPADVREVLFRIADMTNEGLLPVGRFRTWPIAANQKSHLDGSVISGPQMKVAPEDLEDAIDAFSLNVLNRWDELADDPVPLASWAEWELNGGSLHPFYDGCGRISRSFGALLLVRGGSLPPLYEDKRTYFEQGNRGAGAFAEYVRHRIKSARNWLAQNT